MLTPAALQLALTSPIDTNCSPIVTVVSLFGTGWRVEQLFHRTNIGGFLLSPLESEKSNTICTLVTPRTTPTALGDWIEQHIQPTTTKKYDQRRCITESDWSESEDYKLGNVRGIEGWLVCQH